ncbi:hypothetical protein Bca52824_093477 [Brassica carinata]|uniref:HMG box domain-containing protein n=1 Tax=Brassica carinata TaxID=52824 RepID=A0A8X7P4A2_BRACI|nr:hypothetical protein Bca52824_093477 [Brassica carinata]
MAGGGGSSKSNAPKQRKRVEAETKDESTNNNTLLRAKDGSAFARCEGCSKNVAVALISMHKCNLDAKIGTEAKKKPPTAFYFFMNDFRETYEEENRYVNLKDVPKLGGEMWKSFPEDEKNVYRDKAAQLMEEYNKSLESDDADDVVCVSLLKWFCLSLFTWTLDF